MAQTQKFLVIVFVSILFSVISFWGIKNAFAATLGFTYPTLSVTQGEVFTLSVYVSSPDQAINAVSGTVNFPKDTLQVVSVSKANSVLTVWAEEPSYSNAAGTVNFAGVAPNPGFTGANGKVLFITFKALTEGTPQLRISSASVLANDGNGTDILSATNGAIITIGPPAPEKPQPPKVTTPDKPVSPKVDTPAQTVLETITPIATAVQEKIVYVESRINYLLVAGIILLGLLFLMLALITQHIYSKVRGMRRTARRDITIVENSIRRSLDHIKRDLKESGRSQSQHLKEELDELEEVLDKELEDVVEDLKE